MRFKPVPITQKEFERFFEERLRKCKETLIIKAREYASDTDKAHNFNEAGRMMNMRPEQIAFMYMMKHFQSLTDIVMNGKQVSKEVWDEKVGDLLNYWFLIDAIVQKVYEGLKNTSTPVGGR